MLRLKPSELTLTPEDVDETLCRMVRRQQLRASPAPAQRRARTSGHPPPPRLMPGAQRSVGDAISNLGNIPILRPQPQPRQATIAHVDDDSEDSDEMLEESSQRIESSPDPRSVPTHSAQFVSTSTAAAAHPPRHSTRLPFRLGRFHRRLETSQEPFSSANEQTGDFEGTLVEPADSPMDTTSVAGPATPGRSRPYEDSAAASSPKRQSEPSTISGSLRGGACHPQRNRVQSVGQESLHAPSPLRQTQVPSPTRQPESDSMSADEENPVVYLRGYFERGTHNYTFQELVPPAPHTEPIRRTSQPRVHSRSHSSSDAPPSRLFTLTPDAPHVSTAGEDVFWTATVPATGRSPDGRMGERPRQYSSEVSNTSLAYSYYELPENRQSSGEHSAQDSLFQSQHDGAAGSRQASRGTYRSFQLSEAQAPNDHIPRPPTPYTSGFVTRAPALFGQPSASPLPAEPYAHPPAGSIGARHEPAIHRHVSQNNLGCGSQPNAIAAAMEDRVSPLEALTADIGRASQRLGDRQGRQQRQRSSQSGSGNPAYYNASSGVGAYGPSPGTFDQPSNMFGQPSSRYGPPQGAFNPPMAMADDPYTRGVSAHAGQLYGSAARLVSAQSVPATDYVVGPYPRYTRGGRSAQRSSENAPVSSAAQAGRTGRTSQAQDQVSVFEQMHNATRPRQTQRVGAPQTAPFRRNNELSSSLRPAASPRIPPRHGSRQHTALSPSQGNAGRRSVRIDPRLQNQENSGEAEMEMMRQEFESVRVRYDETQQGDVMDETPPRIGRVERHM